MITPGRHTGWWNAGTTRRLIADRRLPVGLLFLVLLLAATCGSAAEPAITELEAFWEDSLAIVRPGIDSPLDESLRRTLQNGVPVQVDVEVRFTRTGFAKTEVVPVTVEYDVWTGWYRVTTPLSPFAIEKYSTVERLFANDLVLLFKPDQVDPGEDWFIKVRAGSSMLEDNNGESSAHGVGDELSGLSRIIFQLFGTSEERGEWSELVKLPKRGTEP